MEQPTFNDKKKSQNEFEYDLEVLTDTEAGASNHPFKEHEGKFYS